MADQQKHFIGFEHDAAGLLTGLTLWRFNDKEPFAVVPLSTEYLAGEEQLLADLLKRKAAREGA